MRELNLAAHRRLTATIGLALACSACATMVGGTTQDVFVQTEPAGAYCKVDRQGATVGLINPTPGKIALSRSKESVVVSCTLAGYEQSNELLLASFTGATVGNILVGGLVGIAVDAASGANNKYPDRVMVVLTPSSFPNEAARDAHFAAIRTRLEQGSEAEIKLITSRCSSTNREICTIEVKQLTDARDKALADLDRKRLAARVSGVGVGTLTMPAPVVSLPAEASAAKNPALAPQATHATPDSFEGRWAGLVGDWNVEMDIRGNTGTLTAQCPRLDIPATAPFDLAADGTFLIDMRAFGAAASGSERRVVSGRLPQVSVSTNPTCLGGTATLRKQ